VANNAYVIRIEIVAPESNVPAQVKKVGASLDEMKGKVKDVSEKTDGSFKNLAGAFTGLVVAAHAKDAIVSFLSPAAAMSDATAKLGVATGVTGKKLDDLVKSAEAARAATMFSPEEAISGMADLTQKLGSSEAAAKALKPAMELAAASAGRLGLGTAVDLTADLLDEFGISADRSAAAVDKLVITSRLTKTPLDEFKNSLGKIGVVASEANVGFEDSVTAFALARDALQSGRATFSGMGALLKGLTTPDTITSLKRYGIEALDATGHFRGFRAVVADIAEKGINPFVLQSELGESATKFLTAAVDSLNGGITDMNGNLVTGAAAMEALTNAQTHAGGVTTKLSEESLAGFTARIENLKGSLSELAATIGGPILSTVGTLIMFIAKGAAKVVEWANSNNPLVSGLTKLATVGLGATIIIGTLIFGLLAASAATRIFQGAMAAAVVETGALATAIKVLQASAGPLGLALMAVGFIGYEIYDTYAAKAAGSTEDLTKNLNVLPDALGNTKDAAEKAGVAVSGLQSDFKKFMDFIAGVAKFNLAIFTDKDFSTLDKAKKELNEIGKTAGMDPVALAKTGERLAALPKMFDDLRKGIPGATENMKGLEIAVLDTLTALRIHHPERTALIKDLEATADRIHKTTTPEQIEALNRYAGMFAAGKPGLESLKIGSTEEGLTPEERLKAAAAAAAGGGAGASTLATPGASAGTKGSGSTAARDLDRLMLGPAAPGMPFGATPLEGLYHALRAITTASENTTWVGGRNLTHAPPLHITVVMPDKTHEVSDTAIRSAASGIDPAGGGFGYVVEPKF